MNFLKDGSECIVLPTIGFETEYVMSSGLGTNGDYYHYMVSRYKSGSDAHVRGANSVFENTPEGWLALADAIEEKAKYFVGMVEYYRAIAQEAEGNTTDV